MVIQTGGWMERHTHRSPLSTSHSLFLLEFLTLQTIFFLQYVVVGPDQGEVVKGLFVPGCSGCDSKAILQVGTLH